MTRQATRRVLLACGLTFGQIDSQDRTTDKLTQDDAKQRATEPAPVVIVQPSVHRRAQDEGCTYMFGS